MTQSRDELKSALKEKMSAIRWRQWAQQLRSDKQHQVLKQQTGSLKQVNVN